jgi:hypothetical protein
MPDGHLAHPPPPRSGHSPVLCLAGVKERCFEKAYHSLPKDASNLNTNFWRALRAGRFTLIG